MKQEFAFTFAADSCAACGGFCCVGESGYIFLELSEAQAIASLLGLSLEEFSARFLKRVGARYSLIERPYKFFLGYACIFFDAARGGCMVYDARPRQCREFPFWESNRSLSFNEVVKQCPFIKPSS